MMCPGSIAGSRDLLQSSQNFLLPTLTSWYYISWFLYQFWCFWRFCFFYVRLHVCLHVHSGSNLSGFYPDYFRILIGHHQANNLVYWFFQFLLCKAHFFLTCRGRCHICIVKVRSRISLSVVFSSTGRTRPKDIVWSWGLKFVVTFVFNLFRLSPLMEC
jgi:hypothetical protein